MTYFEEKINTWHENMRVSCLPLVYVSWLQIPVTPTSDFCTSPTHISPSSTHALTHTSLPRMHCRRRSIPQMSSVARLTHLATRLCIHKHHPSRHQVLGSISCRGSADPHSNWVMACTCSMLPPITPFNDGVLVLIWDKVRGEGLGGEGQQL